MAEQLSFWNGIASDWDRAIGDAGNDYWTCLQEPALRRMVGDTAGQQALDLATGNGIVARWLARGGADVLGTDGSRKMVELATARTFVGEATTGTAEFQTLDLMDEDEVVKFTFAEKDRVVSGIRTFLVDACSHSVQSRGLDIITINMAVMDISDLKPLATLVTRLLKPRSGRCVWPRSQPQTRHSDAVDLDL